MSPSATPASASARNAPASRPSPIAPLKRDTTMPTRRPAPDVEGAIFLGMSLPGAARRCVLVAGHLEVEARHARHLARPREQPHAADVEVAQDLRADAVVAKV